ncbi:T9SS type A sorting domain-containing protein [Aureispira anguillae]|uniref:T9SS type A sorting domain-containing protein n=1 Tax=Aureispira anguillae TaxID=2864201 RepID=A0A915YLD3_9BACT|nr:T9SS type A sorting domain-containing protein [Aureispira anguillae]BDS15362.1 T9SS type A sorting domain-containing protein [Aureispira anguillae]
MKNVITTVFFLIHLCQIQALDFYWKGGDGDFNDPQMWTIGSIGGATATQAPISIDNVYFVASVMNAGTSSITFNSNANCHDFWIDPAINNSSGLIFSSTTNRTLDIYGSMELARDVEFDFSGILRFRSILNGSEIIRTAGNKFKLSQVEFDGGANTEWVLQDSFWVDDAQQDVDNWDWNIPTGTIVLYNGTLNSNKQTIITDFFYSKNSSLNRGILFDSSQIYLAGYNGGNSKAWWVDFNATLGNFKFFSVQGAHIHFIQTIAEKQYGFFGEGMQYDSITGYSRLSIGGYVSCNYLRTNASTYFVDAQVSVNNLYLAPADEHFFNSNNLVNNDFLEIDSFHSPTNCSDFITLRGFAKSVGLIRKKTAGQLDLSQVILQDMDCDVSGGRSYLVTNGINGGGNSPHWIFQATSSNKMKFVDSGNQLWSDPNNWQFWDGATWVTNTLNCIPTPFMDIYVDSSSFPFANKWIKVDIVANCRSFIWEQTVVSGATMHLNKKIHIFGSAQFRANMGAPIADEAIYFHGKGDTLRTLGFNCPKLIFWKHSDYRIIDHLTAKEVHGWVYSTIRGSNITINTNVLSLGNRILDSVMINLTGTFYDFGATVVDYRGNTTINFTELAGAVAVRTQKEYAYSNSVYLPNVYSYGVKLEFYGVETFLMGNLEMLGDGEFGVNNMHITGSMLNYRGKMILHAGNTYEIKRLTIADSLIARGTCNDIITIRAYQNSNCNLQMGAAEVESCFIQSVNNTGVAVATNACIDGGNNNGWIFNAGIGVVYYWRASALNSTDYEGDWSDPNHWTTDPNSLTGSLGGCMPTLADDVVFDSLSFSSTSNGCNIDNTAFCKSLFCYADIRITGDELYVGGNFMLHHNMTNYNQRGNIYFVGGGINTINLNHTQLANCGVVFNNSNGEWILDGDFYLHDSVYRCYTGFVLDAGTFRANGHNITIRSRFRADRTTKHRVLDIRNSTVTVLCNDRYNSYYGYTWDISTSTGMQILSENSTLNFKNNTSTYVFTKYFYMGDGLVYDQVNFLDNDDEMRVYNNAIYDYAYFDGTAKLYGNNTFDSLGLKGGHHLYLKNGKTQTLAAEHGKIIAYGNASEFVYIESMVAGRDAYIHKEYGNAFCLDYVKIKDIKGTKGLADPIIPSRHLALFFETGTNSDNINNTATGIWAFSLPPAVTVATNHDTLFHFCNGGSPVTVPVSFTGTYPYSLILNWYDDVGNTGIDTVFFLDDDNDVTTACTHYLDFYPVANSYYTLDAGGMRCGVRNFNAPRSFFSIKHDQGILVNEPSTGGCNLTNQEHFTHFFDNQTKRPIASVQDKMNSLDTIALGLVQAEVHFDSVPNYWNGIPYLMRHWSFSAAHAGGGKIRLYFSQAELVALSMGYLGSPGLLSQYDLTLLRFEDTIGRGIPDTIPFNVVNLLGTSTAPFSSLSAVLAIEFESNFLGSFILNVNPSTMTFPLDLVSFEAEKEGHDKARIKWRTTQEINIKEFVVERSVNGIDYEEVAVVEAQKKLSINNYQVIDAFPLIPNSYYRLKIIEMDESFTYSPIRHLSFEKAKVAIKLQPNPATDETNLMIDASTDDDFEIKVYNMTSQQILNKRIAGKVGLHRISLITKGWANGIYLVMIAGKDGSDSTHKLVIQN